MVFSHQFRPAFEQRATHSLYQNPPVFCLESISRGRGLRAIKGRRPVNLKRLLFDRSRVHHRQGSIEQRSFHNLTLAGLLSLVKRCERAKGRQTGSTKIDERRIGFDRLVGCA